MSPLTHLDAGDSGELCRAGPPIGGTCTGSAHMARPFYRMAAGRGLLRGHFQNVSIQEMEGRSHRKGMETPPLDGRVSKDVQPWFKTPVMLSRFLSPCAFVYLSWTKSSMNVKYYMTLG